MNSPRRTAAAGATALLLALACRDATAPTLEQRLAGTYDLTTTLVTRTYSVGCGLVPCRDTTVADSAPTLYGTIIVLDTVVRELNRSSLPVNSAVMHQSEDGTAEQTHEYYGSLAVTRDSIHVYGNLFSAFGGLIVFNGTLDGDSIAGTLDWNTYLGCCAVDYYSGTFVARRRP
jgi:hypothetical protein